MAVLLVTYDLRTPGKDYKAGHDYLKPFTYCRGLESVWLLDTTSTTEQVHSRIDSGDKTFVVRLYRNWNSWNFGCANWLNELGDALHRVAPSAELHAKRLADQAGSCTRMANLLLRGHGKYNCHFGLLRARDHSGKNLPSQSLAFDASQALSPVDRLQRSCRR